MATLKIGGLAAIIAMIVGGLIVAWAYGMEWLTGIAVVAVLLFGLVISLLVAVFLPIGNMIVKLVALCVVFALFVLWGFSYLGVM